MNGSTLNRRVMGAHLLLASVLLAILGWRMVVWTRSGWSGMVFAGAEGRRSGLILYSIWPGYPTGEVFRLAFDSPAARAGIARRDVIESVNDVSPSDRRLANEPSTDTVRYVVKGKGQRSIALESPLRNSLVLSDLALSTLLTLFYIVVAGLVLAKKPGDRRAIIFDVMAIVGALSFFIGGLMRVDRGTAIGVSTTTRDALAGMGIVFDIFLVALLLHFALVFPRLRPSAQDKKKWRGMLVRIYVPPAVLAIGQFAELFAPEWPLGVQLTAGFIQVFLALPMILGFPFAICIAMSRSYRESGVEEKRQIRWPVWGTILAILGPFLIAAGLGFAHGLFHFRAGRTQRGNNNAYCQDNDISWYDWHHVDYELMAFVTRVIQFRREHAVFTRRRWFVGRPLRGADVSDIGWFKPDGQEMTDDDWQTGFARTVGVFLNGKAIPTPDGRGEPIIDDCFYVLFNAHFEAISFKLPTGPWGDRWIRVIDSSESVPDLREHRELRAGEEVPVKDHSVVVLRRLD